MNDDILAIIKLKLILQDDKTLTYNKSSLLQGVIMEQIDSNYADILHEQGLKPYSQCLLNSGDDCYWYIKSFSKDAYDEIICHINRDCFKKFTLTHNDLNIEISKKELSVKRREDLFNEFYSEDSSRIFRIDFLSPTSFKRDGRYHFYPDIELVYRSLMQKFDASSNEVSMFSFETLEELTSSTEIIGYNLKTVKYNLEGVKIPSFMGNVTLKIHGPQTMANFARLLFKFGEYSGIGIKTAIGMGGIKFTQIQRRIYNDRKGN